MCGSPSPLTSPFSSPFTSRTSCRTLSTSSPTLKLVDNLRIPPKESMHSFDETHSHTDNEPNAYDFKEASVKFFSEVLTSPPFLSDKGFAKTWTTTTSLSVRRTSTHAKDKSITLNEKTCLSVCPRCQCLTERSDLLRETVRMHRLGLCSTNKKERILAMCQAKINRHEFQAARAEEDQRQDQQLLQGQILQQNLEFREAHQKSLSEMKEFNDWEFHL